SDHSIAAASGVSRRREINQERDIQIDATPINSTNSICFVCFFSRAGIEPFLRVDAHHLSYAQPCGACDLDVKASPECVRRKTRFNRPRLEPANLNKIRGLC